MSRTQKRTKANQAPTFISKLYEMVEDRSHMDVLAWTSSGDSFAIKNISKFTDEILPIYFKHRNFASFIRQLNMYGFRKIRHQEGDNIYMNQNFKSGSRHLLKNITRKIKEEKEEQIQVYRGGAREDSNVNRQITQLRNNQNNLEEICRHFIEQNQRLLEENQNIIRRMQEEDKQKQRKLEELLVFLLTQKQSKNLIQDNVSPKNDMLSIANYEHDPSNTNIFNGNINYESQSPLEAIGNAMETNSQLHKARQIIQGIYPRKNRKRDNNYSIVENRRNREGLTQVPGEKQVSGYAQEEKREGKPGSGILDQPDDKSFLSINDFLNVDDSQRPNFDLQSSH